MTNNRNIKAGILGAGGFTGQELIKILSLHDAIDLVYATSEAFKGSSIKNSFPVLDRPKYKNLLFSGHPVELKDIPEIDVLFLAVPDETSLHWVQKLAGSKIKVIDISGAFRLKNPDSYDTYYGFTHTYTDGLKSAIYGLTEIYREKIRKATLLANPGCYATAAILPVLMIKQFIADAENYKIIIDAKSGTSGAGGRKEKDALPYSSTNENFRAYKIRAHQHIPEISQEISPVFSKEIHVNMIPHLLPLFRGLQTNTYIYLNKDPNVEGISRKMKEVLSEELFIRFYDDPEKINLRNVQNSNFLDFGIYYDKNSGLLQIISVLDNLVKGAAGQAIQNMNLMFGLPEHQGLL